MKPDITEISSILDKKEFERFGKFISSPFFNTEERFIKVFELLDKEGGKITREKLVKKIFGDGASAGDERFRKLVSEFMKLFRFYLSEVEFGKNNFRRSLYTMKQLAQRGLQENYKREAKLASKEIETAGIKDGEYYRKSLELLTARYQIEGFNYNSWKEDLSFDINNAADKYFTRLKLFIIQRLKSIEYSFRLDKELKMTFNEDIRDYINKNRFELKNEYSEIYPIYMLILMFEDPDNKDLLDEFLELLAQYERDPAVNSKPYYEDLINYYTFLGNSGKKDLEESIIRIAEVMDRGDYFKSGIEVNDYKIIIENAISLKSFDWAKDFAVRNMQYINEEYKESISSLCIGKIFLFKKDYNNARRHLAKIEYDSYIYYAEAKLIECRILYEEKKISELLMVIETARKYLKKHKEIGKHYTEVYIAFLMILRKLVSAYEKKFVGGDVAYELYQIEKEIKNRTKFTYANNWLLIKAEEIKKGG